MGWGGEGEKKLGLTRAKPGFSLGEQTHSETIQKNYFCPRSLGLKSGRKSPISMDVSSTAWLKGAIS